VNILILARRTGKGKGTHVDFCDLIVIITSGELE